MRYLLLHAQNRSTSKDSDGCSAYLETNYRVGSHSVFMGADPSREERGVIVTRTWQRVSHLECAVLFFDQTEQGRVSDCQCKRLGNRGKLFSVDCHQTFSKNLLRSSLQLQSSTQVFSDFFSNLSSSDSRIDKRFSRRPVEKIWFVEIEEKRTGIISPSRCRKWDRSGDQTRLIDSFVSKTALCWEKL